mgnify:CR=1 FL=1
MAKGQQRSNREQKKPKAAKSKTPVAAASSPAAKTNVAFGKRGLERK